jgi:outer membrane protein TolC
VRVRARSLRLDLASRLVDLGQKKLDNERDKYKSGLSTLADVVRFQHDLDSALSNASRARVDVLAARTDMLAARGDLPESIQVDVR